VESVDYSVEGVGVSYDRFEVLHTDDDVHLVLSAEKVEV
jgi:hypothetical protein